MRHLKEFDEKHSTVILVQVENETGLLGDSRDASAEAEKRFSELVPQDLISYFADDWHNLHADLQRNLFHFKSQSERKGSWVEVFGKGPRTDELFMAYNYARYLNQVATAGKDENPIPLYTNVWQNFVGEGSDNDFPVIAGGGGLPGDYLSLRWRNHQRPRHKFAPSLDFISPDIYLNDYSISCAKYRHRNQPLFIPEQRCDDYGARRIWAAYGSYQAIGVSPFGIDTQEPITNPFTRHYALLDSVSQIILAAHRDPGASVGFFFDDFSPDGTDPSKPITRHFDSFEITIERCFFFGKPGPGSGIVIHPGGSKFLLIGWGFQVRAKSTSPTSAFTGILKFEENLVSDKEKGELRTLRVLNGDETRRGIYAMMPNEEPDYGGFPICITIPARTMIAEVEFYSLDEGEV